MNHLQASLEASTGDHALEVEFDTALTLWNLYADEHRLTEELTDSQYEARYIEFMSNEIGEDSYDLYCSTH